MVKCTVDRDVGHMVSKESNGTLCGPVQVVVAAAGSESCSTAQDIFLANIYLQIGKHIVCIAGYRWPACSKRICAAEIVCTIYTYKVVFVVKTFDGIMLLYSSDVHFSWVP